MKDIFPSSPLLGIMLCVVSFIAANWVKKRSGIALLNSLLLSIIFIILFLVAFGIPYENFKVGGDFIHFFLGPITVILAVPLYKQRFLLNHYKVPILIGVLIGSLVSVGSVILFSRIFSLDLLIEKSLLSKSVSTPFGIEITQGLHGIEGITVLAIVITGIFGASLASLMCRLFGIRNVIAQGIALGTAAHALGTACAIEMGERQGAMSSLAIGIAGMMTTVIIYALKIYLY